MSIEFGQNKCERKYELECRVVVKERAYRDWKDRQYAEKMVYLVPIDCSDRVPFFMAWLPDTENERNELVVYVQNPVDSPCRVSIFRANSKHHEHHLFVMTKAVEDKLRNYNDRIVRVVALPETEDAMADDVQTDTDIEVAD